MSRFPEKLSSLLPKGMFVFLPRAAARRRAIEQVALSVFRVWGYQEVIPPLFEYLDVLSKALEPELVEKSYKFVDRSNGRVMILRPDVTPQIARTVALLMADEPKPIRLCYCANVFRYEEEHAGREREILQIGGELIGPQDAEADAEVIALVVEILKQLGLAQFRIAIGQIGFFKALLQEMGVPEPEHVRIQKSLAGRDSAGLNEILNDLSLNKRDIHKILGLLELFGQDEAFERARQLVKPPPSSLSLAALDRLQEVYRLLKSYGLSDKILVDLSEVRGFGYYSGMVFEVFAEGVGYGLGGGGRYDHLISQFGANLPSTGFALHVERLQRALDYSPKQTESGADQVDIEFLIIDPRKDGGMGIRLCQLLRKEGVRVIRRVTVPGEVAAVLEQCRNFRVSHAIILETMTPIKGLNGLQTRVINCRTGAKRTMKIQQLLKLASQLSKDRHL